MVVSGGHWWSVGGQWRSIDGQWAVNMCLSVVSGRSMMASGWSVGVSGCRKAGQ